MLRKRIAATFLCGWFALLASPAAAAPPWPAGDPDVVVQQVLRQPGYRAATTPKAEPKRNVFEEAWQWLVERVRPAVSSFLKTLRQARGAGAAFGIMLLIALVSLLVLLIARIVAFVTYRQAEREAPVQTLFASSPPAGAWLERARAAADKGEYARAVAAIFNASLRLLDERGVVPYDDARTPYEYRRLVRSAGTAFASAFDVIAARFVSATFSRTRAAREDYEEALRAYGSLAAVPAR